MRLRPPALFAIVSFACLGQAVTAAELAQATQGASAEPPSTEAAASPAALAEAAARLADAGEPLAALEKAEEAYFAVWEMLPLSFRRVELVSERPAEYGEVRPRESNAYDPDERISIYVDPVGFGWRQTEDGWQADLTADFILATPDGRIIAGQKGFEDFEVRSPRRNEDMFLIIDYLFSGMPQGEYVLTTTMHDRIDGETASFDMPIRIN